MTRLPIASEGCFINTLFGFGQNTRSGNMTLFFRTDGVPGDFPLFQ